MVRIIIGLTQTVIHKIVIETVEAQDEDVEMILYGLNVNVGFWR